MHSSLLLHALDAFGAVAVTLLEDSTRPKCSSPSDSLFCEADYLTQICRPLNSTGYVDLNAPCNVLDLLNIECIYGLQHLDLGKDYDFSSPKNEHFIEQHTASQRLCACESQFWDSLQGCAACYREHGGGMEYTAPSSYISSMSSAYCAATATPTLGLIDFEESWYTISAFSSILSSATAEAKTSTFSDPIGNKTAVSLYYTPEVTGTAALHVGLKANSTPTSTNVVNGQIVPTAAAHRFEAAVAGIVGLAGLVAFL